VSFLPLPPASHLLEINIEFICGKVAIDETVNGREKTQQGSSGISACFPLQGKALRSLCPLLTVCALPPQCCFHQVFPTFSSQGPCSPQAAWRCSALWLSPQPVTGKSPKPALGLGCLAFKAKPRLKPGISQVSKPCQKEPLLGCHGGTLLASVPQPLEGPPAWPSTRTSQLPPPNICVYFKGTIDVYHFQAPADEAQPQLLCAGFGTPGRSVAKWGAGAIPN